MSDTKKTVKQKLISLLKKPFYSRSKKSTEEYLEKKKSEAKIMMDAVDELLRRQRSSSDDTIATWEGDEKDEVYLYDFLSEAYEFGGMQNGYDGVSDGSILSVMPTPSGGENVILNEPLLNIEPKQRIKPIDVWKELETIPAPVSLENLDEKIEVLKLKKQFIKTNRYAKKEVIDMVTRLENRRRYKEFESFFSQFDNTTTDKINALVDKYKLVLKTSDLFIPKFPKEAMDIMKSYRENVKKLCGKSPVFYVIAEVAMFKSEEKRNDPILLVQSPFGIYWQVCGAWDKELVLLEEL